MMLLAAAENGGWRPGIGDPTFVGWLTVVVYFVTAWLCYRVYRKARDGSGASSPWQLLWWWRGLALLLVFLGFNKQLDLQTLLTQLARAAAHEQGWYAQRRTFQALFIASVAGVAVLASVAATLALRRWLSQIRLSVWGLGLLLAFVTIRAASFHHVDQMLGLELFGLRFNWIMELGALTMIATAAIGQGGPPPTPWGGRTRTRNRFGREEVHIKVRVLPSTDDDA